MAKTFPAVIVKGILESGKTTFIVDSLKNGDFGDIGVVDFKRAVFKRVRRPRAVFGVFNLDGNDPDLEITQRNLFHQRPPTFAFLALIINAAGCLSCSIFSLRPLVRLLNDSAASIYSP